MSANSLRESSSSVPASLMAAVISRIESGLCALNRSASITRIRLICRIGPMLRSRFQLPLRFGSLACRSCPARGPQSANEFLVRSRNSAKERGPSRKVLFPLRSPASSLPEVRRAAVFLLQEHCVGPADIFSDRDLIYLGAELSGA